MDLTEDAAWRLAWRFAWKPGVLNVWVRRASLRGDHYTLGIEYVAIPPRSRSQMELSTFHPGILAAVKRRALQALEARHNGQAMLHSEPPGKQTPTAAPCPAKSERAVGSR